MFASLTSRRRRVIRVGLPVALATGVGVCFILGGIARSGLIDDAAASARATAEGALAPLLTQKDLRGPIAGQRYAQILRAVQERIPGPGPIERVTLWSAQGRVLFDLDRALVGTRDPSMGEVLTSASSGGLLHRVVGGELQTFVRIGAGGGQTAVAELDRPLAPVEAGASWWRIPQVALAVLFLLSVLSLVPGLRRRRRSEPVVYVPPRPWKRSTPADRPGPPEPATVDSNEPEPAPRTQAPASGAETSSPDEALIAAEARARAAEQSYWGLQEQYRQALQEIAELEARAEERASASARDEDDARVLREQVREMAERLEAEQREQTALRERFAAAELDANALRERLSLQRTQLDELTGRLQAAEERATRHEAEAREWREQAERLQAELREARAEVEEFRFRTRASGLAAFRELNAEAQGPESGDDEEVVVETGDRGPRVIIGMPPIVPAAEPLPGTRPPAESENQVHPAGA